jgi:hypothetical protein
MAQTLPHDWLEIYLAQRQKGKDFGKIRQELNAQGLPQDTIDAMIKQIDAYELYLVEQKSLREKGLQAITIAVVLLSLPLLLLATGAKIDILTTLMCTVSVALPMLVYGIMKYRQHPQGFDRYPAIRQQSRYNDDIEFKSPHTVWRN